MSSAPARVLSNLYLPSPAGIAIRAFRDYLPPGADPSAPQPKSDRRSLRDILPLIPLAERPEALVIASPEYLPIPADVASFPGTKILLITDWNVCLRFLPDLCPLFDFCFTDWPGYRRLRRAGIANVFHQPLFGHDPAVFRPLGIERNLDVSFCGNLNSGLHGERNRLLARVARWAGPRPVRLRQAFDHAYVEALNRSRLVFNYSIRGEANMRLFEAMACGAAPLVEDSNQEVPILFREGMHYFRYHPDRLEARLDELLSDPARLAAAGEAARIAVAGHTKAGQIRSLLEFAGREAPGAGADAARIHRNPEVTQDPAAADPAAPDFDVSNAKVTLDPSGTNAAGKGGPEAMRAGGASAMALAKLRMLGSTYTLPDAVAEIQALAPVLPGLDAETLPAALLTLVEDSHAPLPAAEAFLERLLSDGRQPPAIAAFLRLRLEARRGHWEAVLSLAEACLRDLDALRMPADEAPAARIERLRPLYSRFYPPIQLGKGFNTDINRAFREDVGGATAANAAAGRNHADATAGVTGPTAAPADASSRSAFARLLGAHCIEAQSRALLTLGRPFDALALAESLPQAEFVSVDARMARAQAAEAAGDFTRARREWEGAFAERPLDAGVWGKLAEAWTRAGDRPALIAFLTDILVLARAFLPEDQAERVRERLDRERRATTG